MLLRHSIQGPNTRKADRFSRQGCYKISNMLPRVQSGFVLLPRAKVNDVTATCGRLEGGGTPSLIVEVSFLQLIIQYRDTNMEALSQKEDISSILPLRTK